MGKNTHLRRSRSWKDLSLFMSKRLFGEDDIPKNPLERSSSVHRQNDTKSRIFNDIEMDNLVKNILTPEEQRARERTFQRKANIKRKLVPTTTRNSPVQTVTNPQQSSQLPGFAFSQYALENNAATKVSHKPSSSSSVRNASPLSFLSRCRSNTGHSRKESEISLPMIMNFDLERHTQGSKMFSPDGGLNFDLTSTIVERELSSEEKTDLINKTPAMHIVDLPKSSSSKGNSTLKRLFSLRKNEKSTYHKRLPSSSSSSKHSPQPQTTIPPTKSIYRRPVPLLSPPPSPPPKRDSPPRLSVQIPDSTMERASKIFQSIYAAHAHAQETYTSSLSLSQWENVLPTPPSESPPSTFYDVKRLSEHLKTSFSSEHRPAPNPKSTWGLVPSNRDTPSSKTGKRLSYGKRTATVSHDSKGVNSKTGEERRRSGLWGSKGDSRNGPLLRGRISAFPVSSSRKSVAISVEKMGSESDTSDDDFEGTDDEWEDDHFGESVVRKVSLREPSWEMLTPAIRTIAI